MDWHGIWSTRAAEAPEEMAATEQGSKELPGERHCSDRAANGRRQTKPGQTKSHLVWDLLCTPVCLQIQERSTHRGHRSVLDPLELRYREL